MAPRLLLDAAGGERRDREEADRVADDAARKAREK
jgi:hypothetical protein